LIIIIYNETNNVKVKVKVKVYTLDIAPLRSEAPPQKRSGGMYLARMMYDVGCRMAAREL